MKKTLYITIEGGDGCGKTTLVKKLYEFLIKSGKSVLLTKEFGSELNGFCSQMRKIALSSEYNTDEVAGQLAFAAIARQHQERVIKPILESQDVDFILSDRGIDSNYAYGPVHGIPQKVLNKIFDIAYSDSQLPDITFFLDAPPSLTRKRREAREQEKFENGGVDRVELKGQEFQEKVRKNFLKRAKKHNRIKIIKVLGKKSPDDILNEVISLLKEKQLL